MMVNVREYYNFSHGCYGSYGFGPTVFPQKLRIIKSHLKWCGRGISQCFRSDWWYGCYICMIQHIYIYTNVYVTSIYVYRHMYMENLILYHVFFQDKGRYLLKYSPCFLFFEANYIPTKSKPEDHMYTAYRYVYIHIYVQGIVGCTPTNVPLWEILYKPYTVGMSMGYNPQESPENTINTLGTLLRVHPNVPWYIYATVYVHLH